MRAIWFLLVLAACAPKPKFPSDDRADREVIDCPTGPALDRAADAAWDTARLGDMTEHAVTCVPLYAHQPLWLLDGTVMNDTEVVVGSALTTTKGEVRWSHVESMDPIALENLVHAGFTAVDLDGDAHDELLEIAGAAEVAGFDTWIVPYAIDGGGKAIAGDKLPLGSDGRGCEATHEVLNAPRGRHLIQVTSEGAGCKPAGVHTYGWDGTQLVEE